MNGRISALLLSLTLAGGLTGCVLFDRLFEPYELKGPEIDALRARVNAGERVRVIARLRVPGAEDESRAKQPSSGTAGVPEHQLRAAAPRGGGTRHLQAREKAKADFEAWLAPKGAVFGPPIPHSQLVPLEVDKRAFEVLVRSHEVESLSENHRLEPRLSRTVPLILDLGAEGDATRREGPLGSGQAVVIIDTGVDRDHRFFGGRYGEVSVEACFSSKADCPNGRASEYGPGAAAPVDGHGTAVAGAAAGIELSDPPLSGVAPRSAIIAIRGGDDSASMLAALDYIHRLGWHYDQPRTLMDVNADRRPDIVGFGSSGVYVALGDGQGGFRAPELSLHGDFGTRNGWLAGQDPRMLADVDGDGLPDVVGFAPEDVRVAFGEVHTVEGRETWNGFSKPESYLSGRFSDAPSGEDNALVVWINRTISNVIDAKRGPPRISTDMNGDGRADLVVFAHRGVYVALGRSSGRGFDAPKLFEQFGSIPGQSWRVDRHPRMVTDMNNDGLPDIVGFGTGGVDVALNQGDSSDKKHWNGLAPARRVVQGFGYTKGSWRVDKHPRLLADLNSDGFSDIVGFGDRGVIVALNNQDLSGTELIDSWVLENFGFEQGWRTDRHLRMIADVDDDGYADIVGFKDKGVYVSFNDKSRTTVDQVRFEGPGAEPLVPNFGTDQAWQVKRHPRMVADVNSDGYLDIVGFGDEGVIVALNKGASAAGKAFLPASRILEEFGHRGLRQQHRIAAVNVSRTTGESGYKNACDSADSELERSIHELRSAGIPTVVASGNGGWANEIGRPACLSSAISVGATNLHDEVTDYSNSSPRLALLAPGGDDEQEIRTSGPGDEFVYGQGTSLAAPHVSGAWAVLKSHRPDASVDDIFGLLRHAAPTCVLDDRNQRILPRIDLRAALDAAPLQSTPELWIDDFGWDRGAWRVDRHPRTLTDVNKDGLIDIVGFGTSGAFVSLQAETGGSFEEPDPEQMVPDFGWADSWRVEKHIRLLVDVNNDGYPDIVGFGDKGVVISINLGNRGAPKEWWQFDTPYLAIDGSFNVNHGWLLGRNPRAVIDVNGDQWADIAGFGPDGVYVSLNAMQNDGGYQLFEPTEVALHEFGENQHWSPDRHVRLFADVNDDKRADIVGFGTAGVEVAFTSPPSTDWSLAHSSTHVSDFGWDQGWRVDHHIRTLRDVNNDDYLDLVGFGDAGVIVALNMGDAAQPAGTKFHPARMALSGDFAYDAGAGKWRLDAHPRFLADVNDDEYPDIVGFGTSGVFVSVNRGIGTGSANPGRWNGFRPPTAVLRAFGTGAGCWRADRHPRLVADVDADGASDIIGFGYDGVWVAEFVNLPR